MHRELARLFEMRSARVFGRGRIFHAPRTVSQTQLIVVTATKLTADVHVQMRAVETRRVGLNRT